MPANSDKDWEMSAYLVLCSLNSDLSKVLPATYSKHSTLPFVAKAHTSKSRPPSREPAPTWAVLSCSPFQARTLPAASTTIRPSPLLSSVAAVVTLAAKSLEAVESPVAFTHLTEPASRMAQ